jgi:hypothetical protein
MFDVGSVDNFGSSTLGIPRIVVEQAATMGNGLDLGCGGQAGTPVFGLSQISYPFTALGPATKTSNQT